ncbi:MAG: DUF1501 domain-containing protein [Ignavibacteriales bacterium]|nr:DUF1501 domain-containing protein [Ignavibacteriales bacterium]
MKLLFILLQSVDLILMQTRQAVMLICLLAVAQAIEAFQTDLKLLGIADKVVLMTFSEFGRRVESKWKCRN